jgi:hypothetical protein
VPVCQAQTQDPASFPALCGGSRPLVLRAGLGLACSTTKTQTSGADPALARPGPCVLGPAPVLVSVVMLGPACLGLRVNEKKSRPRSSVFLEYRKIKEPKILKSCLKSCLTRRKDPASRSFRGSKKTKKSAKRCQKIQLKEAKRY